jgi:hypothetical protein
MRDHDVRECLAVDLRRWHLDRNTLFVDELDLGGLVRVDIAAVNGALWGYEIKSAHDTLRRLPTQVEVYSKVLDYAALVVAECHHDHALDLLPDWWHVYVAAADRNGVSLVLSRPGTRNPQVDTNSPTEQLLGRALNAQKPAANSTNWIAWRAQ